MASTLGARGRSSLKTDGTRPLGTRTTAAWHDYGRHSMATCKCATRSIYRISEGSAWSPSGSRARRAVSRVAVCTPPALACAFVRERRHREGPCPRRQTSWVLVFILAKSQSSIAIAHTRCRIVDWLAWRACSVQTFQPKGTPVLRLRGVERLKLHGPV